MNNGLISKFINGTSGLLNTANQIIPLYEELKPLLKNIINIKNKIIKFNINQFFKKDVLNENSGQIKIDNKKEEDAYNYSSSSPQFFL